MTSATVSSTSDPAASVATAAASATDLSALPIVIVGHVDHGKSTVIGRLLADTGSLPEGKLEQVRERCRRTSKPFEYAFLLDALRDEQAQGITIDSARVFFRSDRRHYLIIDAPGHVEFLKNMVTGASRAHAALLVIDAAEGVQENSRRHGYMLSLLGIRQVAVLVNKMDLVGYREDRFAEIKAEYQAFLESVGIEPVAFIPVSGMAGDNIARPGEGLPWYAGPTVLELLDSLEPPKRDTSLPFRMAVQDVYKFTAFGDQRRIVAGLVTSGNLRAGDHVVFYPSGKTSRVAGLEGFPAGTAPVTVEAGDTAGFTLEKQLYVTRGELACRAGEPPAQVASSLHTSLFWLGPEPMRPNRRYLLRAGTTRVEAQLDRVIRLIDASTLDDLGAATQIGRHDVAECVLRCARPVAFDVEGELAETSRFVIVDDHEIRGGGIVLGAGNGDGVVTGHGRDGGQRERVARVLPAPDDPGLKSLGIFPESRPGLFTVRGATPMGLIDAGQLRAVADLAERWGEGRVHFTMRQNPEVTGVAYEHLSAILDGLAEVGITGAGSGPRVRSVTGCLGCGINAHGLIATGDLGLRLDKRLRGSDCPSKFKIAIAACPNDCPRAKASDLGLVGTARPEVSAERCAACGACVKRCKQGAMVGDDDGGPVRIAEELCLGCGVCHRTCRKGAIGQREAEFAVYVGGCHGRNPRLGRRLPGTVELDAAEELVGRILEWYRSNGQRGERLGRTLERVGEQALDDWLRTGEDRRQR